MNSIDVDSLWFPIFVSLRNGRFNRREDLRKQRSFPPAIAPVRDTCCPGTTIVLLERLLGLLFEHRTLENLEASKKEI